ncbi:hypothetical protein [Wolbachia endosymbiont (group E) of Neria commutata]
MVETTTNNRSAVSAAKNPGLTGYKNIESSSKEPGLSGLLELTEK